ncbi:MAG TPA: response regulator [Thermodesulfobacteriota bacterium]|nr:response regulator [Thermodesulfobacteriota bacterium]
MGKLKILIVEDDPDISELLQFNLGKSGYEPLRAENGEEALKLSQKHLPDLILLDILLPGLNGLEVCRRLKRDPALEHIPIIMVTAKGEEMDRVVGLELGADDYIVKPFSIREILLRIQKRLERRDKQHLPSLLQADGVSLDLEAHTARRGDHYLDLTATEFRLLAHLMRTRGRVQTREVLLDKVWGYSFEGYSRTIDTHIRRIRKKLEDSQELIETVRGVGYRFKAAPL